MEAGKVALKTPGVGILMRDIRLGDVEWKTLQQTIREVQDPSTEDERRLWLTMVKQGLLVWYGNQGQVRPSIIFTADFVEAPRARIGRLEEVLGALGIEMVSVDDPSPTTHHQERTQVVRMDMDELVPDLVLDNATNSIFPTTEEIAIAAEGPENDESVEDVEPTGGILAVSAMAHVAPNDDQTMVALAAPLLLLPEGVPLVLAQVHHPGGMAIQPAVRHPLRRFSPKALRALKDEGDRCGECGAHRRECDRCEARP